MKNKILFIALALILVTSLVIGGIVGYNYIIIKLSEVGIVEDITIVQSGNYPEWKIESEAWFDLCKLEGNDDGSKITANVKLACSQATYKEFMDARVKDITDETERLKTIKDNPINYTQIQELQTENKKLKDCITISKTFEELQNCIK
jgi:hypothetical protein